MAEHDSTGLDWDCVLVVDILEARNLKNQATLGKSDPYAKIVCDPRVARPNYIKTHTINGNLDPEWKQRAVFQVSNSFSKFDLRVYDENVAGDSQMGAIEIEIGYGEYKDEWFPLDQGGEVHATVHRIPTGLLVDFKEMQSALEQSNQGLESLQEALAKKEEEAEDSMSELAEQVATMKLAAEDNKRRKYYVMEQLDPRRQFITMEKGYLKQAGQGELSDKFEFRAYDQEQEGCTPIYVGFTSGDCFRYCFATSPIDPQYGWNPLFTFWTPAADADGAKEVHCGSADDPDRFAVAFDEGSLSDAGFAKQFSFFVFE